MTLCNQDHSFMYLHVRTSAYHGRRDRDGHDFALLNPEDITWRKDRPIVHPLVKRLFTLFYKDLCRDIPWSDITFHVLRSLIRGMYEKRRSRRGFDALSITVDGICNISDAARIILEALTDM